MGMEYDSYQQHIFKPGDPIPPAKTWWIWKVFWILLAITTVEVSVAFMNYYNVWNAHGDQKHTIDTVIKVFFILLTLLKAFYIIFSYMHLGDEKRSFKVTLGFLVIVLTYFIILMMNEGYYQDVVHVDFPMFMQRDPTGAGH